MEKHRLEAASSTRVAAFSPAGLGQTVDPKVERLQRAGNRNAVAVDEIKPLFETKA